MFSHRGFWIGYFFLISPFPENCFCYFYSNNVNISCCIGCLCFNYSGALKLKRSLSVGGAYFQITGVFIEWILSNAVEQRGDDFIRSSCLYHQNSLIDSNQYHCCTLCLFYINVAKIQSLREFAHAINRDF